MDKRFLNVEFGSIKTEIDTAGMPRISQVINHIAAFYGDSISSPERIQLYNKDHIRIETWHQLENLSNEYFQDESGVSLTIQLLPSPSSSRQSRSANLFFSAESKILPKNGIVKLAVPTFEGVADLLYSPAIYNAAKNINITPASDTLRKISNSLVPKMLIGVSGCGKTRCCFDIAAKSKVIYFDCFKHLDFRNFVTSLQNVGEDELYATTEMRFALILHLRFELLKRLPNADEPIYWLRYQLSGEFQQAVSDLFILFQEKPPLVKRITTPTLIFDECQMTLMDLPNRYPDGPGLSKQRALLSALVRIVFSSRYQSYWAGTHLRLKDSSIVASAVGKPEKIFVFTQFNNYSQGHICALLKKWIYTKAYKKIPNVLIDRACYLLSGRVRFISSFITDLAKQKDPDSNFAERFASSLEKVYVMYTSERVDSSFFNFWKKYASFTLNSFTGAQPEDTKVVFQVLLGLVVNFFAGGKTICTRESEVDLISSALVRIENTGEDAFAYSICEPLPIEAAVKYFSKLGEDHFVRLFEPMLFSPMNNAMGFNAQTRGFIFEIVLAIRVRTGWRKSIPDESQVWELFPEWCYDAIRELPIPQLIVSQKNSKEPHDWCLQNFDEDSRVFVMPDFHFGSDGLYRFMSYDLKSSWTKHQDGSVIVSQKESDKNEANTFVKNWCGANKQRRDRITSALGRYPGIVHFRIEFPSALNPNFTSNLDGNSATICVDINSTIAIYMFGSSFIEKWKNFLR